LAGFQNDLIVQCISGTKTQFDEEHFHVITNTFKQFKTSALDVVRKLSLRTKWRILS